MTGIFGSYQKAYADHGIATFPVEIVDGRKKPMLNHWQKVGLKASTALASKFIDADAFGYLTGRRNRITVLDIDTTDETVLEDAIACHGEPPIVIRTATGKFHLPYRFNGEGRHIRPWPGLPIDVLGSDRGMVVAPPSKRGAGTYEIIKGSLDDLDRLKPMDVRPGQLQFVKQGARNNTLWRHCMSQAHWCDDFDALLDVARTFNESCQPPLKDEEVMKVANSAWDYTERGQNWFGQHGAYFPVGEVTSMLGEQDAFILLAFLRANNGPWATFMCTNTLAEKFNWGSKRLAAARSRLIELRHMKPVRQAGRGYPALFQWTDLRKGGQN